MSRLMVSCSAVATAPQAVDALQADVGVPSPVMEATRAALI